MRNIEFIFNKLYYIYKKVKKLWEDNQIMIPLVKKKKVSNKIDSYSKTQHFMDAEAEEVRCIIQH